MGIAFIAAKGKRFKHRTDAAFEDQLASGDLLTLSPDSTALEFRCACLAGKLPAIGARLVVYCGKSEIKLFNHNDKVVGVVITPDAAELGLLMNGQNNQIAAAEVTRVQPLSSVFLIQLMPGSDK